MQVSIPGYYSALRIHLPGDLCKIIIAFSRIDEDIPDGCEDIQYCCRDKTFMRKLIRHNLVRSLQIIDPILKPVWFRDIDRLSVDMKRYMVTNYIRKNGLPRSENIVELIYLCDIAFILQFISPNKLSAGYAIKYGQYDALRIALRKKSIQLDRVLSSAIRYNRLPVLDIIVECGFELWKVQFAPLTNPDFIMYFLEKSLLVNFDVLDLLHVLASKVTEEQFLLAMKLTSYNPKEPSIHYYPWNHVGLLDRLIERNFYKATQYIVDQVGSTIYSLDKATNPQMWEYLRSKIRMPTHWPAVKD